MEKGKRGKAGRWEDTDQRLVCTRERERENRFSLREREE
jgi:hypothetical protein